jgi:hypothetical protein
VHALEGMPIHGPVELMGALRLTGALWQRLEVPLRVGIVRDGEMAERTAVPRVRAA